MSTCTRNTLTEWNPGDSEVKCCRDHNINSIVEHYSQRNILVAYTYSDWSNGVMTYLQTWNISLWPVVTLIKRPYLTWHAACVCKLPCVQTSAAYTLHTDSCVLSVDFFIITGAFVYDRSAIKADKNLAYCMYCAAHSIWLSRYGICCVQGFAFFKKLDVTSWLRYRLFDNLYLSVAHSGSHWCWVKGYCGLFNFVTMTQTLFTLSLKNKNNFFL